MDFKSFKLVQTDMTAQHRVYEGYKTENGVHLKIKDAVANRQVS
ncbi:MAG: hypothetical protein SOR38_02305 [Oscillospiraceae bacterium]|nr:hypothetical protein [Oscillospiraceae bacterium]